MRLQNASRSVRHHAVLLISALLIGLAVFSAAASAASRARSAPVAVAAAAASVEGLTPQELHTAYALPRTAARRHTVAVVVPYDDAALQADLNGYDRQFGLPSCTVANHCLRVVGQTGAPSGLPSPDPSGGAWNTEHALGAEIVHAICQNCSVLVVEASSAARADLVTAVETARSLGATAVALTFSLPETPSDADLPLAGSGGGTLVAATGDGGYTAGASFPASLANVLAVSGTTLRLGSRGAYRSESAWSLGESGCSLYLPAAAWQASLARAAGCGTERAEADVSVVADPGAAVRITGAGVPDGPWYEVSGTSLSAPIMAGILGLAGSGDNVVQRLYKRAGERPSSLRDVTSGMNSSSCGGHLICAARRGYDGPTGLGSPYGLGAFLPGGPVVDRHHPDVSLLLSRGRIRIGSRGATSLSLRNTNVFPLAVALSVKHGSRTLGRGTVTLAPLGTGTVRLTLPRLASGSSLRVTLGLRGGAGATVTVRSGARAQLS